jgi:hypothetical protein
MKVNWLVILLGFCVLFFGCAMFEDEFRQKPPDPVILEFRYPGILNIKLVSTADIVNPDLINNRLILQNMGHTTLVSANLLIDAFSSELHTYENLVSSDNVLMANVLEPSQIDTILLRQTEDFIENKSDIEISLIRAMGIFNHPLNGIYQGSFKTYKEGSTVSGGGISTTIDFFGNFKTLLKAENVFNIADGVVSLDSLVFSSLKKDAIVIKKLQSSIQGLDGSKMQIKFLIQTDSADSTLLTLQNIN